MIVMKKKKKEKKERKKKNTGGEEEENMKRKNKKGREEEEDVLETGLTERDKFRVSRTTVAMACRHAVTRVRPPSHSQSCCRSELNQHQ